MPTVTPSAAHDMTGAAKVQTYNPAPDRQMAISEKAPQAAPPEATDVPQVDPQIAARQAEMARREQMIRRESRRVATERQELAATRAENERLRAWQTRLTQEPGQVLSEVGLTGDQITESILNSPNAEEMRLRRIEQQNKSILEAQEANQTASYEQAKKQIRREAGFLVDSDKAFETTKAMNATEAIVELIEQTFLAPESEGGGYLMNVEDAAREVEEYLVAEALKVARIEKIRSRLSPAQAQHATPPQQQQRSQLQTLSNRQMPSSAKPSSDRERRERAILAFMGKLS